MVAISIYKRLAFLEDVEGRQVQLHYCRTKDGKEIDFYVAIDQKVILIEVKASDKKISNGFEHFRKFFTPHKCVQLVLNIDRDYFYDNVEIRALKSWLANINTELS